MSSTASWSREWTSSRSRGALTATGADGLVVYCADVGSIPRANFGWARVEAGSETCSGGAEITELAAAVADDLTRKRPVALGFECPLFIPVPDDPMALGRGREGEGSRPWSAQAGAGSMGVGLAQVPWILAQVSTRVSGVRGYLEWRRFAAAGTGIFLWEAFVTAKAKGATHADDAAIGARAFCDALPDPDRHNAIPADGPVLSLIGAALIRAGWSDDLALLDTPALVIKAVPGAAHEQIAAG